MKLLAALLLAIIPLPAKEPLQPEKPEILAITNGNVTIGIDQSMGGSITLLNWKNLDQKNVVNIHDPGRLIQQSYYAGKRLNRQKEGQHKAWSPWSWNPIQGGGVGSWAQVSRFEKQGEEAKILFSETTPKLWDMPDENASAIMHQWTTFEADFHNVLVIQNRIICNRQQDDPWGPAALNPQEVPACYFTRNFDTFKTYLGSGEWRLESQAPGPPWGRTTSPKHAMACFQKSGQGVAIFSPSATSWNFGPHRQGSSTDPTAGPCSHIAPVTRLNLGPKSTLTYRYWLIVGTEKEITTSLDLLWKKYATERITLTNPTK